MRVALYLRQSLDRDGLGAAVTRQEAECREMCARLGYEITESYIDNDVSATSGVIRPSFERMLADKPTAIVAWHQDRLLRLTKDLERIIEQDVPVFTVVSGTLDLSTPAGRAVARTVATWSQYEGEQKAERQRAAHRQRAAAGRPWATRRPFGFAENAIEHHPIEAPILRDMYADAIAGTSQSAIAKDLNQRGIHTTLGNQWRQGAVRTLLLNPRNAGLRSYHGEVVGPGEWEPIVSEAVYAKVMERFTSNPPRRGGGSRKYLLAGLALCGVCGAKMRTGYTNRKVRLYVCTDGSHVGRKAESVEELISGVVVARLSREDAIHLLARDDDGADGANAAAEVKDARDALDALATMYASGDLTLSAFKAGNDRAKIRLAAAEAALPRTAGDDALRSVVTSGDASAAWDGLNLARRRSVIDALMTVHIDKAGRTGRIFDPETVRIEWRQS